MEILQPDFICIIFGKMMVSKYIRTNNDIHDAVNEWRDNPVVAEVKYGHISKWNTGRQVGRGAGEILNLGLYLIFEI